jgi:hypothetical protein
LGLRRKKDGRYTVKEPKDETIRYMFLDPMVVSSNREEKGRTEHEIVVD